MNGVRCVLCSIGEIAGTRDEVETLCSCALWQKGGRRAWCFGLNFCDLRVAFDSAVPCTDVIPGRTHLSNPRSYIISLRRLRNLVRCGSVAGTKGMEILRPTAQLTGWWYAANVLLAVSPPGYLQPSQSRTEKGGFIPRARAQAENVWCLGTGVAGGAKPWQ